MRYRGDGLSAGVRRYGDGAGKFVLADIGRGGGAVCREGCHDEMRAYLCIEQVAVYRISDADITAPFCAEDRNKTKRLTLSKVSLLYMISVVNVDIEDGTVGSEDVHFTVAVI